MCGGFFFQAEDGIRAADVTGVQTCALPISGGHPILGYDIDPRGARLIPNAAEADQVRTIFDLDLECNALMPVVRELNRRGWHTKRWVTGKGEGRGGKAFTKCRLYRILTNMIYTASIEFKGQTYLGEQEAIVETAKWDRVQEILHRNGRIGV